MFEIWLWVLIKTKVTILPLVIRVETSFAIVRADTQFAFMASVLFQGDLSSVVLTAVPLEHALCISYPDCDLQTYHPLLRSRKRNKLDQRSSSAWFITLIFMYNVFNIFQTTYWASVRRVTDERCNAVILHPAFP